MPNCPTIIDNAVQVKWIWSIGNIDAVNVTHALVTGAPTIDVTLANSIHTAMGAALVASGLPDHWGTTTTFLRVSLRDMRTANLAEVDSTGAQITGAAGIDQLPPQTAAVITLRTLKAGKSFRGRIYMPGFGEEANDADGAIATAVMTSLGIFAGTLPTVYTGGLQLAVASRQVVDRTPTGNCAVLKASQITPVTNALVRDTRWDTQRRRAQ
jgi:hypothetical protein